MRDQEGGNARPASPEGFGNVGLRVEAAQSPWQLQLQLQLQQFSPGLLSIGYLGAVRRRHAHALPAAGLARLLS